VVRLELKQLLHITVDVLTPKALPSPPISSELDFLISLTERDEGINEYDSTVGDRD